MKLFQGVAVTAGTLALSVGMGVIGMTAPASAATSTHNPNHLKTQITSAYGESGVKGKAKLNHVSGDKWRSRVEVKGLAKGTYDYSVVVNDVVAPGGGGHFTLVKVCTLKVVSPTATATCADTVKLPHGAPVVGAGADILNSVSVVAQGTFAKA